MPTYGETPLFRNEYLLLRATSGVPDDLTAALRSILFPPDVTGDKLEELSAEEREEIVTVIANRFAEEYESLLSIDHDVLLPRYDDTQQRHFEEADAAFASGVGSTGRSQREDYKDALAILRGITDTPTGRRDYGVWFQIGWLLRQTEAPLTDIEEAFYQAVRLSRATPNAYFALSSRHLAATQQALGNPAEAYATLESVLQPLPNDPFVLWEAARAASLLGKTEETLALVERCLTALPPLTALLFRDPVLEPQRAAIAAALHRRQESARVRAQSATERWRAALDLVRRAESAADISLPIPSHLTEGGAAPPEAEDDTAYAERAGNVLRAAKELLQKAIEDARASETRYRRHVEKLFQDKETWERSLVALKAEAEAMGVSLEHPPVAKGLLRKRTNPQHERVFLNFHSCRGNLSKIDKEIRENLPEIRANLAQATKRREQLEQTEVWLQENGKALI